MDFLSNTAAAKSFAKPSELYVLDLRRLWREPHTRNESYDIALCAACLQGLLNREHPQVVLYGLSYGNWASLALPQNFDGNIDRYVLGYSRRSAGWLDAARLVKVDGLVDLIERFRGEIRGLVLWDDAVEATANVATTIAGVEGLIPVRYALQDERPGCPSLYRVLTRELGLPVEESLVGRFTGSGTIPDIQMRSTGSAKCDAYLWSKVVHLDSGLCRPDLIGYYEDAFARRHAGHYMHWIGLRDYLVSERAFVTDLSVWDDETPIDDPSQLLGTDRRTLEEVFQSARRRAGEGSPIRVFGFPPWAEKYTNAERAGGKHGPVSTEWELARFVTPYDGHLVVDIYQGFTANLSLFRHAPVFARSAEQGERVQAQRPLSVSSSAQTREGGQGESQGGEGPAGAPRPTSRLRRLNVLFYMGDYCDIGAVYNILPMNWDDPRRGEIPLGWCFTPAMLELMPDLFRWMVATRSENDHFMFGPGLYGYNMPNELPGGPVYDANAERYTRWCRELGIQVTGFCIGHEPPTPRTLELYRRATPTGVLTNHWRVRDAAALVPHLGLFDLCTHTDKDSPRAVAKRAEEHVAVLYAKGSARVNCPEGFVAFRCIWVEPSLVISVVRLLEERLDGWNVQVLDPVTFFSRFRVSGERRS